MSVLLFTVWPINIIFIIYHTRRISHEKNEKTCCSYDCSWWSNKKENKTRDEVIQQELDANAMAVGKQYIIYDTNG